MASGLPDFHKLLQQTEQLRETAENEDGQPPLRDLKQLVAESRRLASEHSHIDHQHEAQAQMLLASKGVDIARNERNLRHIDLPDTYEPLELISDLDVDKFLDHQHQMLINGAIVESSNLTTTAFRKHYNQKIEEDWSNAKRELMGKLKFSSSDSLRGSKRNHTFEDRGSARKERREPVEDVTRFGPKRKEDIRMVQYARAVKEVNLARRDQHQRSIVSVFSRVAADIDRLTETRGPSEVLRCWKFLGSLIGDTSVGPTHGKFNAEHKQYQGLHTDNAHERKQATRAQLIRSVQRYTEERFCDVIQSILRANPRQSRHSDGGKPSLNIRGYLQVQLQGRPPHGWAEQYSDMYDGYPLWPTVFFFLRAGKVDDAVRVVDAAQRAVNTPAVKTPALYECLVAHQKNADERHQSDLSPDLQAKLAQEYNQFDSKDDPFRIAVYNIVGHCDPNPEISFEPPLCNSYEDYLWLKMSLLHDDNSNDRRFSNLNTPSQYTLKDLQEEVVSFSSDYWSNGGRSPLTYFIVLAMTLQFEEAVAYLVRETHQFVDGVHFGIVLSYYGLLRLPDHDKQRDILFNGRIDMARIIEQYVKEFAASSPIDAFHYLLLLRADERTPIESSRAAAMMSRLIVNTSAFEQLIGTLNRAQLVKSGCVYQFLSDAEAATIVTKAAEHSATNGKDIDAIWLYRLANRQREASDLLLERLGALAKAPEQNNERRVLKEQAVEIRALYKDTHDPDLRSRLDTISRLLIFVEFFDLYFRGPESYERALFVIDKQVFPFSVCTVNASDYGVRFEGSPSHDYINRYIELMSGSHDCIQRIFPDVALACMYIFKVEHRKHLRNDALHKSVAASYKSKAESLVEFVGYFQNMNSDVLRKLHATLNEMS